MRLRNVVLFLLGAWALSAHADVDSTTEAERRLLVKIANELAHLKHLAEKAAVEADPDARFVLDYVGLQNDLQAMQQAIERHITLPSRSPRRIESLELAK